MILALGWTELDALGSLVGGAFTAAAFLATLAILIREIQTRRAETREREQERRDEERRQARLVYATLDPDPPVKIGEITGSAGGEKHTEVHIKVYNHSDMPVWDIRVPLPGRERRPLLIEHVPPHSSKRNGWRDAPVDWYLMNVGAGCPGTPHWTALDVIFVDNLGRRWGRSGRSEPVRLFEGDDLPSSQ